MEELTLTKESVNEYQMKLRDQPDVQELTGEINISDANTILNFGQKPSEEISKMSDALLSSMKSVNAEEAGQMLTQLTKIMDKFDIKEIEDPQKQTGFLQRIFKTAQNSIDKIFAKYDDMGKEIDKVYVILRQYEQDIKKANADLAKQYETNQNYFQQLERYIVAGELGVGEIEAFMNQVSTDTSISEEDRQMQSQRLTMVKDMLSQRIYDLRIAENIAMQTCPMIQTMELGNFNLLRKINSSFIITLPIFKQCLVQAIQLKRQAIQAKSIQALDEKTNELLMRNAANTASQSVNIARMASGSSVNIETLQKTYEDIKKGIEEASRITEEQARSRMENTVKLEEMKNDMKTKNFLQTP